MNKNKKRIAVLSRAIIILLVATAQVHAQGGIDPYAETGSDSVKKESKQIQINPKEINVISASSARVSPNLNPIILNFMFLWLESIAPDIYNIEWKVKSTKAGSYEVTAMILGQHANIELTCNGQILEALNTEQDWSMLTLGKIKLKKGINTIQMLIKADDKFKLSAIELTQPKVQKNNLDDALKVRQNPDWFRDAGYGLMFQWTNRATPKKGDSIKNWEDKVNDFNVERFADMVEQSGAAYVIWSITWGQQYISAPIKSLDKIIQGRTTKRDLLGEMADLLDKKGIKLIFYYHYGYDCYHSKDSAWMQAAGGYKADKTELYQNIKDIISEVGNRYKDKLGGWFFDGAHRYYDCHFDGSTEGILSAPFKEISLAARKGNSQRILAYNSWILPRLTEYQDYFSGENLRQFDGLEEGAFSAGIYKGLMAHTCFTLEKRWGHIDWNTIIPRPKYSVEQLTKRIKHAQENRYPLSINLEMYEDGSVSPESLELLKKLRGIIRGK